MAPSDKHLLKAKARIKQKLAAGKVELKKIDRELLRHHGQMQKAAHVAIAAAVLRGLSEGWIKLDLVRLRREAIVKPARGLDPTEAIADLLDQTLRPAPPVPAEPGTAMSGAAVAPRDGYGQDAAGALDLLPVESVKPAPTPAHRPAASRPVMGRAHWTPAGDPTAPGDQESKS